MRLDSEKPGGREVVARTAENGKVARGAAHGEPDGAAPPPAGSSPFDLPVLASNVAHELTNALFALHLHLDAVRPVQPVRGRGNGHRGARTLALEGSRQVVETILGRLDELSRGLRLVARVSRAEPPSKTPPRTILSDWWIAARVVLQVSVPKGIDLHAEWSPDLPAVDAEPAELTACAVAIIRRVVGRDRIALPCTLRLFALPEGRWIRLMAVAHPLSEEFAAEPAANGHRSADRFRHESDAPRAASVLIARSDSGPRRRAPAAPGKNP
jgi:hypothetical protein